MAFYDITENQQRCFPITWVKRVLFACWLILVLMLFPIRINHTVILDDPFDDPPGLCVPDRSPEPTKEQLDVSICDSFLGKVGRKN